MSKKEIRINELRVRAGSLTNEQAHRLGELIASRLAGEPIAPTQTRKIPAVTIEVTSTTTSIDGLASQIASKIRNRLK